MKEFFIESSLSCSRMAWFVYRPDLEIISQRERERERDIYIYKFILKECNISFFSPFRITAH